MWDPAVYRRFGEERSRPFDDLVARIGATGPRAVVDLGCGPGTLTATLASRWPAARITGLDSSTAMIEQARSLGTRVAFTVGDLEDWRPAGDIDVVLSNAALQWVPGHRDLLTRWAGELPAGAWLAFQVPGNFAAPSHRHLREVAAQAPFVDALGHLLNEQPVDTPEDYAARLTDAGCAVQAWETTYLHQLPDDANDHPVLRWLEGTALRPVRAALDDGAWSAYRQQLQERLTRAYPPRAGLVYFPFRRIFVVARTGPAIAEEER